MRASRGRGSCVVAVGEEGVAPLGPPAGAWEGPGVELVCWVLGTVVVPPPLVAVFCVGCEGGWVWVWELDGPAEELGSMPFVCAVVAMAVVRFLFYLTVLVEKMAQAAD